MSMAHTERPAKQTALVRVRNYATSTVSVFCVSPGLSQAASTLTQAALRPARGYFGSALAMAFTASMQNGGDCKSFKTSYPSTAS